MMAKKNKSARASTRRKSSKLVVGGRALQAVLAALGTLRKAADESEETRCAEELAFSAALALAERAGLAFLAPTPERVRQAHNVLFGGSPSAVNGMRIRDIADVLRLAAAGKGTRDKTITISPELLRSAGGKGDIDKLITVATVRLTPTLAWHGMKTTTATTRRRLASIDPRLAEADIAEFVNRLTKGDALSGVVADLLLATGALGTSRTAARQSVQNRVTRALNGTP